MAHDPVVDRLDSPTTRQFPAISSITINVVSGSVDVMAAPHQHAVALDLREITGPPLTATLQKGALRLEQVKDGDGQVWGVVKSFLGGDAGSNRPRARLTLTVPEDTTVTVRAVNADVLVGGVHGAVTARTVSGGVTIERTTGKVDTTTVTGDVECASPAGELSVKTVSGAVTVQDALLRQARLNTVSGRTILDLRHGPTLVTANSVSGEVSVRIPKGSGYDATVTSASGNVVVDGEPLMENGKRGGHRHQGDRGIAIKGRTATGDLVVLRRQDAGAAAPAGPVIGEPTYGPPSDVQDDLPGDRRQNRSDGTTFGGGDAGTVL